MVCEIIIGAASFVVGAFLTNRLLVFILEKWF
jgi:hypothetical protein